MGIVGFGQSLDDRGVLAVGTVWRRLSGLSAVLSQSRLEEGKEEREKLVLLLSANSVSQSGSVGCLWGWAEFLRHGDAPGRSRVLCQGVGKEKQLLPWVLSRT